MTARDAAQPDLPDCFDFINIPRANRLSPPAPVMSQTLAYDPCTPANMRPQFCFPLKLPPGATPVFR